MSLQFTPVEEIPKIVSTLSSSVLANKVRRLSFRKQQLLQLYTGLEKNQELLKDALKRDLAKPELESMTGEISMCISECVEMIEHIDAWSKPRRVANDLISTLEHCEIRPEPFGLMLIIGAWNYPIQLTFMPLIGAIAAGNCAVIKPSELSPHSAQAVLEIVQKYLDPSCFRVVNGAVKETTVLLEQRFDHIVYTGSGNVGKIIMSAAAKNLTPVTLELGGKSPTIVDKHANVATAAKRIAWGRYSNVGQTCVAPDYVLVYHEHQKELIDELKKAVAEYYGTDPQKSKDYGRIVSKGHFNRLKKVIDESRDKVVFGGQTDEEDLYIAPTILSEPTLESLAMKDEIFGPILPVITYKDLDQAIAFINQREKPLALYVFTTDKAVREKVINSTSAGGTVVNDTLMHATVGALPFGGVGASGMGAYHGKHSFDQFSHKRAVMVRSAGLEFVNDARYPPYTSSKLKILLSATAKRINFLTGVPVFKLFLVVVIAFFLVRFPENRILRSLRVLLGFE